MRKLALPLIATIFAAVPMMPALRADEGMWTFDNLPLKILKEKYGFTPTPEWLDHVRQSAISLGGCSASFVSANGLVLTNHHCVRGQVNSLSTPDNDLLTKGYTARNQAEELKMRMNIRVLKQMKNVTERVNGAVRPNMDSKAAEQAKTNALNEAVREMNEGTGLSCSPVRLYQGGEFWVYGYEAFTDVRLVAVPEHQAAAFGGDYDNFTYPRHDLDFAIIRVYKDDKPYNPDHFLKWSVEGLKDGELTFVAGHPGSTARNVTYGQMLYARDTTYPLSIKNSERTRTAYLEYGKTSPENRRAVQAQLLGVENSLKATKGYYDALQVTEEMRKIKAREDELRSKVNQDPQLRALAGQSWAQIDRALASTKGTAPASTIASAVPTGLMSGLRAVVSNIENPPPPQAAEGGRAPAGGRGGGGAAAAQQPVPRQELDLMQMEAWLKDVQTTLPASHHLVQAALAGKTPNAAAKSIIASSMNEQANLAALREGGKAALAANKDHAVLLARAIYSVTSDHQRRQTDANAIIADHASRIARARIQAYGKDTYPDATGTLRLSFGPVSTFEANGTIVQPFTTFGGMYDRHVGWGGNDPNVHDGMWNLPDRWLHRRPMVGPDVKLNFSHSVDIIGGNSGSPVINAKGEVVGVIFDGIITMLHGRTFYKESENRGVSVDARGILEALDKVMDGRHIVKELTEK
jgi:hypothetical protein